MPLTGETAYLFPGQASQYVGMGKDLRDRFPAAKERFQQADDLLGMSLSRICFEGPEEELKQTRVTQPAIFLHSCIVYELLGSAPAAAAGHSLGEYSALVAAGALSFEEGLALVARRGLLMQEAGTRNPGTMAAIVGAPEPLVAEICAEAGAKGIVQGANFNSPGQIVVSGSIDGVREAMRIAKEKGVRIVRELVVSGAFHSPLMQYAQEGLRELLDGAEIRDAAFPVYANVTGEAVREAARIREMLLRQVTSAVLWENSVRAMIRDGIRRFVEIGPGSVLQGLAKRIDPAVGITGFDTAGQLAAHLEGKGE